MFLLVMKLFKSRDYVLRPCLAVPPEISEVMCMQKHIGLPFPSPVDPVLLELFHYDPSVLNGPTRHGS